MNNVDIKILKILGDVNAVLKNSFDRYYIKYSGEASAGLEDHSGDKKYRLTYSTTSKPMYRVFDYFQVPEGHVLYIDAFNTFKALDKRTKIDYLSILDGTIYIASRDPDLLKIKNCVWENDGEVFHIPIGQIRGPEYCDKVFDLATVRLSVEDMQNVSNYVNKILSKDMVRLEDNGHYITVGKPILPGINKTCELYIKCNRIDEMQILVHLCMVKEQVYNYHNIIAFSM